MTKCVPVVDGLEWLLANEPVAGTRSNVRCNVVKGVYLKVKYQHVLLNTSATLFSLTLTASSDHIRVTTIMAANTVDDFDKTSDVHEPNLDFQRPASEVSEPEEALPKGQGDVDAYASTFNPGLRFYLAFVSLMVITLMAALDATSLSVAIPKITRSLNGTAIEGFWSGTSFLLTSTVWQI